MRSGEPKTRPASVGIFQPANGRLAAAGAAGARLPALIGEAPPLGRGMRDAMGVQIALVGPLVADLPQQVHDNPQEGSHKPSASRDCTNGVSFSAAERVPPRTPIHTRMESTRITATMIRNTAVT